MKQLLSGNEAIALGAYHAGMAVATAYPGTPSTEILETIARMDGVYAEWSINEKVALEVGMRAGADDFINKPFDEDQLAARLVVAERILNLQSQVSQLSGLLPICCVCKKVRDDQNYWQQVESYISKRTDVRFSHGYCPDCYKKVVKELEGCAGTKAGVAT